MQKNTTYWSSDGCNSFLLLLNTYFKELENERACHAQDIVLFADEMTSTAWKEMIRMYISYLDKNSKSFCLDFLTLQSISSTKSEVIIHKIKEVLLEWGIDISRIGFVCFDGTKAMSSEKTGVQQGYRCEAPFSIYVNCQCHRLTLCFKLLVNKFPWLSEIDKLFLGSWKTFHYSSLNYHIFPNYNKHMIYSLIIWLKLLSLVGFPMDKHVKVRVIRPNSSCPRWNN